MKAISAGSDLKRSSDRSAAMCGDWARPVQFKMVQHCYPGCCAVDVAVANSRCNTQEGNKMSSVIVVFAGFWIMVSPNASHSAGPAWMKPSAMSCCVSLDQRQRNPPELPTREKDR